MGKRGGIRQRLCLDGAAAGGEILDGKRYRSGTGVESNGLEGVLDFFAPQAPRSPSLLTPRSACGAGRTQRPGSASSFSVALFLPRASVTARGQYAATVLI